MSPASATLHQVVSITLSVCLYAIAKRASGPSLAAPCDLVLADDTVVQPDLVYYSASRRQPIAARLTTRPDLAIEILSTGNPSRDRVLKSRLFAEYWIVDPVERSFEFFVLVEGKYQLQPQATPVYRSPRFDDLTLDPIAFWGEVDRQVAPS